MFTAVILFFFIFSAKTQSFCGFEDPNICGFSQANGTDNFDWTRAKGSTPSADTGPSADHTCKSEEGKSFTLEWLYKNGFLLSSIISADFVYYKCIRTIRNIFYNLLKLLYNFLSINLC